MDTQVKMLTCDFLLMKDGPERQRLAQKYIDTAHRLVAMVADVKQRMETLVGPVKEFLSNAGVDMKIIDSQYLPYDGRAVSPTTVTKGEWTVPGKRLDRTWMGNNDKAYNPTVLRLGSYLQLVTDTINNLETMNDFLVEGYCIVGKNRYAGSMKHAHDDLVGKQRDIIMMALVLYDRQDRMTKRRTFGGCTGEANPDKVRGVLREYRVLMDEAFQSVKIYNDDVSDEIENIVGEMLNWSRETTNDPLAISPDWASDWIKWENILDRDHRSGDSVSYKPGPTPAGSEHKETQQQKDTQSQMEAQQQELKDIRAALAGLLSRINLSIL